MWLHYTAPPLSKAQVVQPPAEINVALLIPDTVTGVMLSVVVPLPSYGQRYDQIDASVNFTQFSCRTMPSCVRLRCSGSANPTGFGILQSIADTFSRRRPLCVITPSGICLFNQVSSHEPKISKISTPGIYPSGMPLLLLLTPNLGDRTRAVHGPLQNQGQESFVSQEHSRAPCGPARWRSGFRREHCRSLPMVQPDAALQAVT